MPYFGIFLNIDTTGAYDEVSLARVGYRIELRRVSFVSSVVPCDVIPLSGWIVNSGNAPCYTASSFYLRLARADMEEEQVVNISRTASRCYPGEDMVFAEDVSLSDLPAGEYDVELGLFSDSTGYPVVMGIEGRISDGFYSTLLGMTVKEKP